MLYSNAQLARVYLHAWQVTGRTLFRTVAEKTLGYVMREMLAPGGGFYSTQHADSEGVEGTFFVWTPDEIREVLGDEEDALMAVYGVTRHGNASAGSAHGFEGKNILEFVGEMEQRPALAEARRKLFDARETRVRPGRDDAQLARLHQLPSNAGRRCRRHCQGADLLERPDAGRFRRGSTSLLPPRPGPGEGIKG